MEGGGERKRKAGRIELDWNKLLPSDHNDDEPPPVLVIKETAEESKPQEEATMEDREDELNMDQYLKKISDKDLIEKIARVKRLGGFASSKLSDGGEKLRANLRTLEAEWERRKLLKSDGKCEKATPLADAFSHAGSTNDLSPSGSPLSCPALQSTFALHFYGKMDDKRATKPSSFTEELSTLNPTDHKNRREKRLSQMPEMAGLSSRQTPFKSPSQLSINIDAPPQSNGERLETHCSTPSPHQSKKDVSHCFSKKETARFQPSRNSRRNNRKTVVLVDEEEIDVDVKDHEDKVSRSCKETRIYYPSRDDPDFVEICYSDLDCLAPESYLSSTIMNFYIRYLQNPTSPTARKRCDYHFFSTYFYKKLKSDVLSKSDRENSFVKFRRWWKGVNIFEKAYIFLPIHENLHWSLVIICIPKIEDGSGPIILHLDSLKFHTSKQIFNDVKSFLVEEWKFLKQEEVLPALPIADHIWRRLSRRIDEKVIEVPQQKNEYDCGLFVLFFIERFIEEAPERLKKKDLEMFDKQWFRPEEASSLRRRISDLLKEEFKNANECE